MKKEQVQIGGIYTAKVSGRNVPVRIDREHSRGGWDATSLASNKKIRIKTAQKLSAAPGGDQVVEEEEIQELEMEAPEAEAPEVEATETGAPGPVVAADAAPEPVVIADAVTPKRRKGGKTKAAKTPKAPAADTPAKAMGCLNAAAEVLKVAHAPMRCKDMITAMAEKGLWSSIAATPEATLYSAILREINTKGDASRFRKTERGHFAFAGKLPRQGSSLTCSSQSTLSC